MRSLVKRATAAAVSTMGSEAESSHASDSGVGTKNSSRPGSRRRRLKRSRSATRIRRRSLGEDTPSHATCRAAAPPRRSADCSIAAASTPRRRLDGKEMDAKWAKFYFFLFRVNQLGCA